jgi:hypothetical protein
MLTAPQHQLDDKHADQIIIFLLVQLLLLHTSLIRQHMLAVVAPVGDE